MTSLTSLNEQVESVTSMKESIWNLQQVEKRLQDEIDTLGQDRDKLQNETREVRSQRLNEEANLVRLKGQQKVIEMLHENEQYNLYKDVELPLTTVLAKMEIEGFPIDRDVLESINVKYKMILEDIKKTIFALIGHELNLNSPRQVGELIYDELQLKKKGNHVKIWYNLYL